MPRIDVYDLQRSKVGEIDLDDSVFGVEVREHLYYEVVKMQLANRRAGTACTKGRAEVAFSTRKLFRQKGTGRARRGSRKSPVLRGGGVVFGPKPRDYSYRVPRTMRKAALRSALSGRLGENRLFVVEDFSLPEVKTRSLVRILERFGLKSAVLVDFKDNDRLRLSARNLPKFRFLAADGVNVYDILRHENIIVSKGAVRAIEGALKA
jgi:large subunit ribosomal protein L4